MMPQSTAWTCRQQARQPARVTAMNRLQSELQRLFRPEAALAPVDGELRAVVLELAHPLGWAETSRVWQAAQAELGLPPPAIAVSGRKAYQLWFSFAPGVAAADALELLTHLKSRHLNDPHKEHGARLLTGGQRPELPPEEVATDQWSAFVAPDLAPLFDDERWLDHPPGQDAQAELLSHFAVITPDAVARALAPLRAAASAQPIVTGVANMPGPQSEPERFLLRVMNDDTAHLQWRIEAAKALLAHARR